MYNTTNLTNATDIYLITKGVSDLSGGYFAPVLLFSLFAILLMIMKRSDYDTKASLVAVSFMISALSVLLWALKIASQQVMIICILFPFIFILIYKFTN